MTTSYGQDFIPDDFPWDDCRRLYSSPNGFAIQFLQGKSEQDYSFLVQSAYTDAKSIMMEWIRLYGHVEHQSSLGIDQVSADYAFLSNIYNRSRSLPTEQFFLLIAVVYLAQCKAYSGVNLLEQFFELHEAKKQRKVNFVDVNSPDLSWVDLAELLSESLRNLEPAIQIKLMEQDEQRQKKSKDFNRAKELLQDIYTQAR